MNDQPTILSRFPLERLPLEIRYIVYEHYISGEAFQSWLRRRAQLRAARPNTPRYLPRFDNDAGDDGLTHTLRTPTLLLVNGQIRQELRRIAAALHLDLNNIGVRLEIHDINDEAPHVDRLLAGNAPYLFLTGLGLFVRHYVTLSAPYHYRYWFSVTYKVDILPAHTEVTLARVDHGDHPPVSLVYSLERYVRHESAFFVRDAVDSAVRGRRFLEPGVVDDIREALSHPREGSVWYNEYEYQPRWLSWVLQRGMDII